MNNQATQTKQNEAKQNGAEQSKKPKKPSKLSTLREMLSHSEGYTKKELSEGADIKMNTVNCQIYFHLPNRGMPVERLEDGKYRFVPKDKIEEYLEKKDK